MTELKIQAVTEMGSTVYATIKVPNPYTIQDVRDAVRLRDFRRFRIVGEMPGFADVDDIPDAEQRRETDAELLQKALRLLERWERLADLAQDAWDADPMNPDREAAADNFYELEWHAWNWAGELIERITGADQRTAREMLKPCNREKLNKIM